MDTVQASEQGNIEHQILELQRNQVNTRQNMLTIVQNKVKARPNRINPKHQTNKVNIKKLATNWKQI